MSKKYKTKCYLSKCGTSKGGGGGGVEGSKGVQSLTFVLVKIMKIN